MAVPKTAWIDLASPAHPFFFGALLKDLEGINAKVTARRKTETEDLASLSGLDFQTIGRDFDNKFLRKIGIPLRTVQLTLRAPAADISLSSRNAMCILASKIRGIPSIHFTDNDITAHVDGLYAEELYTRFESMATINIVPAEFDTSALTKWGASPNQIFTYDGYKEDIYVANFEPASEVLDHLPFDNYVVLRPEALDAAYVDSDQSIVSEILDLGVDSDLNFVYLPRARGDDEFAEDFSERRVFTPEKPLDGLQLAWNSVCVATGSGTMAREAACMNKPAVSFFPNSLLSVDQSLVEKGRMIHSRDASEIIDYVLSLSEDEQKPDLSRSKEVHNQLISIVSSLIRDQHYHE